MPQDFRCNCPFTSALDVLGDKWMLVIVKQMLIEGKETLKTLQKVMKPLLPIFFPPNSNYWKKWESLLKHNDRNNKKTNHYLLTDKGLALTPILLELAIMER
jgi:DNA-binding HxlR family transcriptional regulator